jgi:hypothetical protein
MAATLIDVQSRTASGLDAFAGTWSREVPPASGHTMATVHAATVTVSTTAYVRKHRNGISGGPQEGSS